MKELRPLSSLQEYERRGLRPPGYVAACLAAGELDADTGIVRFTPEAWTELRLRFQKEPPLPSLGDMAVNAAGAVGRGLMAAATGQQVQAPEGLFRRRMEVCAACEFFRASDGRCSKCGCFTSTPILGKAHLMQEDCPVGKWPKI